MIRRAALALCCLLAGPAAWAQSRVPTHVACVGDSITYGYAASSSSASYPSDLQRLFGTSVKVQNFGHSGATLLSTGDLPYQVQSEYTSATTFVSGAGASSVVDIVIMLGTNDTKSYNWTTSSGTRAQQFQTDCGAMVDHFAQLSTHPLVYLALPPEIYTNSFGIDASTLDNQIIPIIKQVAAAKNVPIIDLNTPTKGHAELFSDGVHPTDSGYMLLAQLVHDALLASTTGAGGAAGSGAGGHAGGPGGHGGGAAGAGGGGRGGGAGGQAGASAGGSSGGAGGIQRRRSGARRDRRDDVQHRRHQRPGHRRSGWRAWLGRVRRCGHHDRRGRAGPHLERHGRQRLLVPGRRVRFPRRALDGDHAFAAGLHLHGSAPGRSARKSS